MRPPPQANIAPLQAMRPPFPLVRPPRPLAEAPREAMRPPEEAEKAPKARQRPPDEAEERFGHWRGSRDERPRGASQSERSQPSGRAKGPSSLSPAQRAGLEQSWVVIKP
jgi:hypothetical protein